MLTIMFEFKRGQITVVIILGIVMLLLFGIISYSVGYFWQGKEKSSMTLNTEPVKTYIESCLKKVGEDGLIFVGKHGGYVILPPQSDSLFLLPYYLHGNESYVIPKTELENQLSFYVKEELPFCLKNFLIFTEQGYELNWGKIKTTTSVTETKVHFNLDLPVTLIKGGVSKEMNTFSSFVPSRIFIIRQMAEDFLNEQKKNSSLVCISCFTNTLKKNLRIESYFLGEDNIMFIVIDEKSQINHPYKYSFINKYKFEKNGTK